MTVLKAQQTGVDIETLQATFAQDGYAIIDTGLSDAVLDEAGRCVETQDAPHHGTADEGGFYYGQRVQDGWKQHPAVEAIATHPRILDVLSRLNGRTPLPFQILNFPVGTEQHVHSDAVHFNCWPNDGSLCGVWVALEDIDETNGPLVYYPGSHRLPELYPINFGLRAGEAEYQVYEQRLQDLVRQLRLEPSRALLKRGQALIWAGNLLHGGDRVQDPRRTRLSQVTHYFFEGSEWFWTPLLSALHLGRVCYWRPEFIGPVAQAIRETPHVPPGPPPVATDPETERWTVRRVFKKLLPPILVDAIRACRRRSHRDSNSL